MLEHRAAEWGQYGFYTASGIPHRVGHLMPALCKKKKKKKRKRNNTHKKKQHTTARSHRGENNIITMLARGKKKVGLHAFFLFSFLFSDKIEWLQVSNTNPVSELKGSSSHSSGHSLLADTWHFVCFVLLCFSLLCFKERAPVDHKASKSVRFLFFVFFLF